MSGDGPSPVHDDDLAGDVIRRVSCKKDGDAFELARIPYAWDRTERFDAWFRERDSRIGQSRVEEAWRNRVDANALPSPRGRELAREPHQARLTRRVAGVVRTVDGSMHARD